MVKISFVLITMLVIVSPTTSRNREGWRRNSKPTNSLHCTVHSRTFVNGRKTHSARARAHGRSYGKGYLKANSNRHGAEIEGKGSKGVFGRSSYIKRNHVSGSKSERGYGRKWKSNKHVRAHSASGGQGNAYMRNGATKKGSYAGAKGSQGSFARAKYNKQSNNSDKSNRRRRGDIVEHRIRRECRRRTDKGHEKNIRKIYVRDAPKHHLRRVHHTRVSRNKKGHVTRTRNIRVTRRKKNHW